MWEEKKEIQENIIYGILKNNLNIVSIKKLPFIIGRKEKCDLFINNPSISKKHAIIQFDEDEEEEENNNINKSKEIILIDNSLNGTYVNGTKITNGKKILLETGDKISFGNDKNIYIFELMNYDNDKTIIYPNMLSINKIETNPVSLVNEEYYQKSEINHLNTIKTKNSENVNNSNENINININQDNEIKSNLNEENITKNNSDNKKEEKKENSKENDREKDNDNDNISKDNSNKKIIKDNYYNNLEQIFSLKQEIFELKKENNTLKSEINILKDSIDKTNNNINNINNNNLNTINNINNKNNDISFKNNYSETSNSLNNSTNINLLAEDLRELGLFRRVKEALVPNYSELNFEELSLKFDNIIIEYKNKYNIEEILINMENEFNNEIIKFNNIISLQQEQKRDTLNKINYLFNKENNSEENNNYLKANKYLMEQLNDLISDKEINIKLINQLKGEIIKLKTEINLYKTINNKNKQIKNLKNSKILPKHTNIDINENINKNNIMSSKYQMKNYIDYNIDKYSIGFDYNKYKSNFMNNNNNFRNDLENNSEYYKKEENNNYSYLNNNKNKDNYIIQNYENENDNKNDLSDDYKRLNILIQNSQDNLKYQEIIKQKELIVNGLK